VGAEGASHVRKCQVGVEGLSLQQMDKMTTGRIHPNPEVSSDHELQMGISFASTQKIEKEKKISKKKRTLTKSSSSAFGRNCL
jgi:hypothetical protein